MNATAARPERNDTANPIATMSISAVSPESLRASRSVFAPAPRMIGVASRKAKRVESPRSSPRNSPAEIVMPEREMPGRSAIAWAAPMSTASISPTRSMRRRRALMRSARTKMAEPMRRPITIYTALRDVDEQSDPRAREIEEHRERGPEMERDVEAEAELLRIELQRLRHEDEVRGRAHRQEFGQPLHQAE